MNGGKQVVMRMDSEMAMRATEDIEIGQDITPPLPPLSFSLYDSSLSSHCSSCFRPLPTNTATATTTTTTFLRYCSNGGCFSSAYLHFSSGEHHLFLLLRSDPSLFPHPDSSDLRAALRLLHVHHHRLSLSPRLLGLLTNRRKLLEDEETSARVRAGGRVLAMARAMRDGRDFDGGDDCEMEEAALCLVITNGVEINVTDVRPIGIGVYDWRFSWINHGCSPNSCYRFVDGLEEASEAAGSMRIEPCGGEADQALRQSELLLKFQFICGCRRCRTMPQTYVDYALEDTFLTYCHKNNPKSLSNHCKENAVERFRDAFDSAIMEYMDFGDPVLCCEKIEGLLSQGVLGQHLEESRGVSHVYYRSSPLHHLSLNAYTTLYSTYKIRASQSFDGKRLHSFDMSRISAAYSLLLAGATQHLLLYEPSCITSAATFWINAGDSLLYLARSLSWNLFANCVLENHLPISNLNCPRCLLMDKFELGFPSQQTRKREFDAMSREFLMCVSIMTPKVWSFLVQGCQYLKAIKDPIDFSWLGYLRVSCIRDLNAQLPHHSFSLDSESSFNLDSESGVEGGLVKCVDGELAHERRTNIFELGVHCLLYGGYLSCICYGHRQHRTDYIRNISMISAVQLHIAAVQIPHRMHCITVASSILIRKIITWPDGYPYREDYELWKTLSLPIWRKLLAAFHVTVLAFSN
ncbi:hypothetical protein Cgig2_017558 [Carnegiea gigantea]|uniref:SET domain-containing protein n=1 Tax=Carnegiea gigantea TaxID=171969 RepID=A0A9Q1QLK5_9CARY|nr:hypothetical protein Cgig2_017558 [Carnegiea gigantea]